MVSLWTFFLVAIVATSVVQGDDRLGAKVVLGRKINGIEHRLFVVRDLLGGHITSAALRKVEGKLEELRDKADRLHTKKESPEAIAEQLERLEKEVDDQLEGVVKKVEGFDSDFSWDQQVNCSIFAGFPDSMNFTCHAPSYFLFELLGDGRIEHVVDFLDLYRDLDFGVTVTEKDLFLLLMLQLLLRQTLTNPPQYVSHGTDHSVRVMKWSADLLNVPEVADGMKMAYGCNDEQCKFVLSIMGLMHDVGYADIDKHKVPKWLHAVSSGIMVDELVHQESNNVGTRILQSCGSKTGNLTQDWITAIATHNFDDGFCQWKENNPLYADQCTFKTSGDPSDPNSKTTPVLNRTEPYTRNYSRGYAHSTPLTFAVRVADNLDAVRTRLTPIQNDPTLMQFFRRVYVDAELRNSVGKNVADLDPVRTSAIQRAATFAGIHNATGVLLEVMQKTTEQSFLHFYSNWVIESSDINPELWTIDVQLYSATQFFDLELSMHPGPALYQINRLASSALSCYITPTVTFLDVVRFNFNMTIPGVEGGSYLPLRSFTKQPVYDATGKAKYADGTLKSICDPYCGRLTMFLTSSPEPCLDTENQPTANCDYEGFSNVPPFTDLSYPGQALQLRSTTKKGGKQAIIIACSVGGGVLLLSMLIGIIIIVRQRGKRATYTALD